MKKRVIDLNNTPILANNICKYIVLDASTPEELKMKIKEYERLLVNALTNKYRLVNLSFDNSSHYSILPDGKYQTSILLNFSGVQKDEISSPEETLEIVKRLKSLESKFQRKTHVISHDTIDVALLGKHCSHTEEIPIDISTDIKLNDAVSSIQNQILENLITKVNVIKIAFSLHKKPKTSMNVTYEYIEELSKTNKYHEPEDR